jgi:hypothetical protein
MNFGSIKSKLSLGYLVCFSIFFVVFFFVDKMAFARFLGFSVAHFMDDVFIFLLLLGLYVAFKFDIFLAGACVALSYAFIVFPSLSQWHQELGIYDGAFSLIIRKTFMAIFPAMFFYSIIVPFVYLVKRKL